VIFEVDPRSEANMLTFDLRLPYIKRSENQCEWIYEKRASRTKPVRILSHNRERLLGSNRSREEWRMVEPSVLIKRRSYMHGIVITGKS
jgi:hypothetical protein